MTTTSFADQFQDRFHGRLPRGLRDQAARLSWDGFVATYGRATGPLALGRWCCLDAERPATRLGPQGRTYQATIAVRGVKGTCTAAAQGPLAALTTMLYERGITLEILGFHQLRCGTETATFIHGSNGQDTAWAMGFATDPGRSALEAVITCANRLLAVR
ncbi:2-isopropylmalate synthase [[Mycobacterium] crassicus]|uniref:Homocitrate synthase n=1 Tax=[Mycobacterium] crassicus TaxID=2872309 RepID=A0ABU5XKH8_9MYCO|nr:homocitrate synthase [Mycolicibacter sp. MYC098]MEB3022762.1 homocitrate synthase [Mycolicibacter sp. MYC098]